jgi:outer membrane receptor protein involved in Fe transport
MTLWIHTLQAQTASQTSGNTSDGNNNKSIVVTATRIHDEAIPLENYTGNLSTITSEEIKRSGKTSLVDILEAVAGVTIVDSSGSGIGSGMGATVNLRGVGGFGKVSTIVLLNGVRLNQLANNAVFWPSIPLSEIQRIEILKGGNSGTIYGEGALSGVINIITKSATEKPQVTIRQSIGSSKDYQSSATYSNTVKGIEVRAHLGRQALGGYRNHSKHHAKTASLNLKYNINETATLHNYSMIYLGESEFTGSITPEEVKTDPRQSKNEGQYHNRVLQNTSTLKTYFFEKIRVDTTIYLRKKVNDVDQLYKTPTRPPSFFSNNIDQKGWGLQNVVSWNTFLQTDNTLVFGVNADFDNLESASKYVAFETDSKKYALFVRDTFIMNEHWTVEAGLRYDKAIYDINHPTFINIIDYDDFSPSFGVKYNINSNNSLFLNTSRSFKIPPPENIISINKQFGKSNFDLLPEKATNVELGFIGVILGVTDLKASLYQINIKDEILFNAITFQNTNFSTQRQGLEIEISTPISDKLRMGIHSNFSKSKFDGGLYNSNPLPLNPKQKHTLFANYQFNKNWNMQAEWLFVNNRIRGNDFQNQLKADNYDVLNINLGYTKDNLTAFLHFSNFLNKDYSVAQASNGRTFIGTNSESPMPKIAVTAGVEYTF